jgi:serine/threonine protein kinase
MGREVEVLLASEGSASERMQAAVKSGLDTVTFPLVGKTISHYRIMDGLGGGGMGLVYRAEDIKLGRQVALKFLPDESAKDPATLDRFEREARSASVLEHPNICPIYEFGEHEGKPFLVMQLLEGQTLRELLSVTTRATSLLELPQLIDLALQIIEGLDAAHHHGIIHRDIKPENLFITKDECVKILDFGLAKLAHLENDSTETLATLGLQTHPGTIAGTVGYMSPEQIKGENLDARTDLFSFGVVLYEMVTGKCPFDEDTLDATFEAILNRHPVPLTRLNSSTTLELARIIRKALEKHREVRYQNAREVRAELKRLKHDTETEASGQSASTQAEQPSDASLVPIARRGLWPWVSVASVAIVAIAMAWFWPFHRRHSGSGEWRGGVTPPRSRRTVHEPLSSYGSHCRATLCTQLPVSKELWSALSNTQ